MVLVRDHYPGPGDLHVWLRSARPAIDHQLQAQERGTYAVSLLSFWVWTTTDDSDRMKAMMYKTREW